MNFTNLLTDKGKSTWSMKECLEINDEQDDYNLLTPLITKGFEILDNENRVTIRKYEQILYE